MLRDCGRAHHLSAHPDHRQHVQQGETISITPIIPITLIILIILIFLVIPIILIILIILVILIIPIIVNTFKNDLAVTLLCPTCPAVREGEDQEPDPEKEEVGRVDGFQEDRFPEGQPHRLLRHAGM